MTTKEEEEEQEAEKKEMSRQTGKTDSHRFVQNDDKRSSTDRQTDMGMGRQKKAVDNQ